MVDKRGTGAKGILLGRARAEKNIPKVWNKGYKRSAF